MKPVQTVAALLLLSLLVPLTALAGGPYTIYGVLLGFDGKPIAGYPMLITAIKPEAGIDPDNTFYRIPNFDKHQTTTDAEGRFVMRGVEDYPQVANHKYRIWGGNMSDAVRNQFPYVRATYTLDLSLATAQEIDVVIKSEPSTALRILAKDKDGRPYNGTISLGFAAGPHSYNRTVPVVNGEAFLPSLPVGNAQQMGRVVIMPEPTSDETLVRLGLTPQTKKGFLTEGAILDRAVQFLPFKTVTVEVNLPFASK